MSTPLSELVRSQTRVQHDAAERSPLMTELIEGAALGTHLELQVQLWFIYEALESQLDAWRNLPEIAAFHDPRLNRLPAIATSFSAVWGTGWRDQLRANPETLDYAADIRRCADQLNGPRFLAHHYTRYLGDLSGGRIIGRNLQRATGAADEVVGFYSFPDLKPKPFKDEYRARLDSLPWDEAGRETFLAAVRESYVLNERMFRGILNAR